MYTYIALYKGRRVTVEASTIYTAQTIAAKLLKAKKYYDVTILRADIEVDPAAI